MNYNLNGKNIRIPDADIERSMKILKISHDEAIQLWLEDEGYLENEVVEYAKTRRHPNLPGMVIPDEIIFKGISAKRSAARILFCLRFLPYM